MTSKARRVIADLYALFVAEPECLPDEWRKRTKAPEPDGVHMGPRCQVGFKYANGVKVLLDDIGGGGGGVFEGSEGKIKIDRGRYDSRPKKLDAEDLPKDAARLYNSSEKAVDFRGGATEQHLANWIYCIKTREEPAANVEVGHRSTTLCHLGNIARWAGRPLEWDPDAERFKDDDEANGHIERTMRAPYQIDYETLLG